MCRGVARGLKGCSDGWPGPLTPYVGDSRCRQKVPAKLVCGQYLFSLSTITRGYHHGLSRRLPAHASRPKNVSRSVISFAHTTLQKPPAKNQSRARERLEMFAPNKIRNTSRPVVSKHLAPRPVVVQNGRAHRKQRGVKTTIAEPPGTSADMGGMAGPHVAQRPRNAARVFLPPGVFFCGHPATPKTVFSPLNPRVGNIRSRVVESRPDSGGNAWRLIFLKNDPRNRP